MSQQSEAKGGKGNASASVVEQPEAPATKDEPTAQPARQKRKSVDERIADYTKWLMIGTALLAVATFWLAVSTNALWKYAAEQAHDMKESIEASREANRIAVLALGSDRPWISVSSSVITSGINKGSKIYINTEYRNAGKEPAVATQHTAQHSITEAPNGNDTDNKKMNDFVRNCMSDTSEPTGIVTFPTAVNGYKIGYNISKDEIDDDLINEKKMIVIQGCFRYKVDKKVGHTTYCFYSRPAQNDPLNLSFCAFGNDAD